jgi:hypothetical protein
LGIDAARLNSVYTINFLRFQNTPYTISNGRGAKLIREVH